MTHRTGLETVLHDDGRAVSAPSALTAAHAARSRPARPARPARLLQPHAAARVVCEQQTLGSHGSGIRSCPGPSSGLQAPNVSSSPCAAENARASSLAPSHRGTDPTDDPVTHPPKALPANTTPLGFRTPTQEFEGDTYTLSPQYQPRAKGKDVFSTVPQGSVIASPARIPSTEQSPRVCPRALRDASEGHSGGTCLSCLAQRRPRAPWEASAGWVTPRGHPQILSHEAAAGGASGLGQTPSSASFPHGPARASRSLTCVFRREERSRCSGSPRPSVLRLCSAWAPDPSC